QVSALEPVDVGLCFVDVLPQGGCFPQGTSAFQPGELMGHLVERIAQSPDSLHGLGGIAFTRAGHRCTDGLVPKVLWLILSPLPRRPAASAADGRQAKCSHDSACCLAA